MTSSSPKSRSAGRLKRLLTALACAALTVAIAGLSAGGAPAQSLQERLDETQAALDETEERKGVLTTEISRYSSRISRLEGQVAGLRNREAALAEELAEKQAQLEEARRRLEILRERLRRAIALLEQRLVEIYKSGEPDVITVILSADGFDDLLERAEYFQRLEEHDSEIVGRVRELRNEMRETVERVREARDAIAERKQELERTRAKLESRTTELTAARSRQQATLAEVREQQRVLEGDLSEISAQIEEQLSASATPLPAGPIRGGSSGMIWPVNGSLTSGFGLRWGRMHEGIDIAAPSGTPIRAAKSGNIVLAAYTGGYGNYTCIDHGGGLSTCYAHQSGFARTGGSVGQGSVIGYVGNTGHSFGDHLHFEVRINGAAVDPLGYL
jgi:murein DD-endopeptidase MepM/ murein hydrolase activator NlpD